jgi:hypothetical protein
MADRVPAWATTPLTRDRLYVELLPSAAPATERWNVDSKAAYLIGRSADAVDIPCPHKSASRVHACLAHRDEALYLLDLGSVHGECAVPPQHFFSRSSDTCPGSCGALAARSSHQHPAR